jgi:hypothetical protein
VHQRVIELPAGLVGDVDGRARRGTNTALAT